MILLNSIYKHEKPLILMKKTLFLIGILFCLSSCGKKKQVV